MFFGNVSEFKLLIFLFFYHRKHTSQSSYVLTCTQKLLESSGHYCKGIVPKCDVKIFAFSLPRYNDLAQVTKDFVPRICQSYVCPSLSDTWSYPPVFSKRRRCRLQEDQREALLLTRRIPNIVSFRDAFSPCIQIHARAGRARSRTTYLLDSRGFARRLKATYIHTERARNGRANHDYYTNEEGVATITFLPLHSCCSFIFNRRLVPRVESS